MDVCLLHFIFLTCLRCNDMIQRDLQKNFIFFFSVHKIISDAQTIKGTSHWTCGIMIKSCFLKSVKKPDTLDHIISLACPI